MNSLQILSILSLDKLEELRGIFHVSKYYCLLYQSEEFEYITLTSKKLFTSAEALADYLLLVLSFDSEKGLYTSCCKFDNTQTNTWTRYKVKKHFLQHKHYTYNKIIYKIVEFDVTK